MWLYNHIIHLNLPIPPINYNFIILYQSSPQEVENKKREEEKKIVFLMPCCLYPFLLSIILSAICSPYANRCCVSPLQNPSFPPYATVAPHPSSSSSLFASPLRTANVELHEKEPPLKEKRGGRRTGALFPQERYHLSHIRICVSIP